MKAIEGIGLTQVQAVYSGPEGDLWELIMGEQIHIGGMTSSLDLAEKAGLQPGWQGIDLCCCNGAGMRFLLRFCAAGHMTGVDATEKMIARARERCSARGWAKQVDFVCADVCASGLPDGAADFVWGEDAWCYVVDKEQLIGEAVRLVKPGGIIAFTDWVEGPAGLDRTEAQRFLAFMKFPTLQNLDGYRALLESRGCAVRRAEDTQRFAPHVDLYLDMLNRQLTYDALQIIGFDQTLMQGLGREMVFMQALAHAGKIAQGLFVAQKAGQET